MELEKQVCSLELSKRLRELGVKQESLFYWTDGMRYDGAYDLVYRHAPLVKEGGGKIDTLSAFTVAELGGILPIGYATWRNVKGDDWWCGELKNPGSRIWGDTEADARAKMLVYLIENKLVDPISSNER